MNALHEVVLQPLGGDGRLTAHDVAIALDGLRRSGAVDVRIDECADFEAEAPSLLARELSGCLVTHRFGPNARRVADDWLALYERAAAEFLAVEASHLRRHA